MRVEMCRCLTFYQGGRALGLVDGVLDQAQ